MCYVNYVDALPVLRENDLAEATSVSQHPALLNCRQMSSAPDARLAIDQHTFKTISTLSQGFRGYVVSMW